MRVATSAVEGELSDEDRSQQRVAGDEGRAVAHIAPDIAARRRRARRLLDPEQQRRRDDRQSRGDGHGHAAAKPLDEHTAERWARSKSRGAGDLDPRIRRGKRSGGRHHRGNERRCRDAVGHSSAGADEAEHRQQGERERPGRQQHQHEHEGHDPQALRRCHQAGAGHPVGQHAEGNCDQQERQRLGRLQRPDGARPG
jgi:hypothetical protein